MPAQTVTSDVRQQDKAKVFISYSRKDMAFADRLEATLKARGFEPLIDRTEIYAFEEWWKRIEALIAQADTVVFVLSPDSVASEVALNEVAFAASLNKRFAPVVARRVDDKAVPAALAKLNFIFFDDAADFEESAERLADALSTDIGWIRMHTEVGEAARRWAAANRPGGLVLRSPLLEEAERWIAARPANAPAPTEETQAFIRQSRQGATRRRNMLTGSLAAGLLIALILAGLAYWQRGIAVEQEQIAVEQRGIAEKNEAQAKIERDNAMRNFVLAQKTADSLVIDIAQGLRDVQGMSVNTVRKILETAKATFEQLATSSPDNLSLQRSRGVMLSQFGETYRTLGDLEQALQTYREGLAIRERLAGIDRNNAIWQRDLVVSHFNLGEVLLIQSKLDDALKEYRAAIAIAEPFTSAGSDNADWELVLSVVYEGLGKVLASQGKMDEALKVYHEKLRIALRLAATDPDNAEWQRNLASAHNFVGNVLVDEGKLDEALKNYREDVAVLERLVARDQSQTLWRHDLAIAHDKVGYVLEEQSKFDEALRAYRDSLALRTALAATDSRNTAWQRELSVSYNNVGDMLKKQGRLDEALKFYRDSVALDQRLAATDQSNAQWQRDLTISYNKVGDILLSGRKFEEALAVYNDSLAIRQRLAEANPGNNAWQRELSVSYDKVGNALKAEGKLDAALKAYRESLAIRERLAAVNLNNKQLQADLQFSIGKIGNIAYSFIIDRNFTNALNAAEQAVGLAPMKVWLYLPRGHALMFLDRPDEARALYLRYRGEKNVSEGKPWETLVLEDFAKLRKSGLIHPLMDEVEMKLNAGG